MKGNNVLIYTKTGTGSYTAVACAKTCDLQMDVETIEVSSPTSGKGRQYIPGRTSWSVNVSGLCSDVKDILKVGTVYKLKVSTRGEAPAGNSSEGEEGVYLLTDQLLGEAILISYKITATRGNIVTSSASFQGSGILEKMILDQEDDSGESEGGSEEESPEESF